jgi:dolichol-phosphate mannosyltransferase
VYPVLSVVIPFYNEAETIRDVCEEVERVLAPLFAGQWELVMVDDGSRDATLEVMRELAEAHPHFRVVRLARNAGQSAALDAGIAAARGDLIATLDGDGQNDPADIPRLMEERERRGVDMMCGVRTRRADSPLRRVSSRLANGVRRAILDDGITDVGCSIRVFRGECMKRIRFFRNAHRFFPALFRMNGFSVDETRVNHRSRLAGSSKYGFGINSRLWAGLFDLAGVYWLKKRTLRYEAAEEGGRAQRGAGEAAAGSLRDAGARDGARQYG